MDTDARTRRRHLDVYRGMTPEQRVELAVDMSEELRAITMAAIRSRNPSLTEQETLSLLIWTLYGVRLGIAQIGTDTRS